MHRPADRARGIRSRGRCGAFGSGRVPITLAGTPPAMHCAGRSFVTTAPAATTAPSPMVTPASTTTFAPSQAPSPMTTSRSSFGWSMIATSPCTMP